MLETVPRDGVSALRDDETMFLQQSTYLAAVLTGISSLAGMVE